MTPTAQVPALLLAATSARSSKSKATSSAAEDFLDDCAEPCEPEGKARPGLHSRAPALPRPKLLPPISSKTPLPTSTRSVGAGKVLPSGRTASSAHDDAAAAGAFGGPGEPSPMATARSGRAGAEVGAAAPLTARHSVMSGLGGPGPTSGILSPKGSMLPRNMPLSPEYGRSAGQVFTFSLPDGVQPVGSMASDGMGEEETASLQDDGEEFDSMADVEGVQRADSLEWLEEDAEEDDEPSPQTPRGLGLHRRRH